MTSEYPLVKGSEPEVRYFINNKEGDISYSELASLYIDEGLIGSTQINYFTNGLKNFGQVERVKILNRYQNNDKHYGSIIRDDVVQHIKMNNEKGIPSFNTESFKGRLASDADDLEGRLTAVENRGVDVIFLHCDSKLKSFYERGGYQRTDDIVMKIELNNPGYSSLE